jgi:hypothetical protein
MLVLEFKYVTSIIMKRRRETRSGKRGEASMEITVWNHIPEDFASNIGWDVEYIGWDF